MPILLFAVLLLTGCTSPPPLNSHGEPSKLRLGYFPNLTHAQPIIGVPLGDYQEAIGPDVELVPYTFKAGPAAIEALYANHVDITYVGPCPALNGYLQSKGEEVRVIAGSARNGVVVVGSRARDITKVSQLEGGRIATPSYGNTQDISARYFLGIEFDFKLTTDGGKTDIIPVSNPDIETLFAKNQLDAAWVPEPWGTRLIKKNLGNEIVQENELWPDKSMANTSIIARRDFVEKYPELVKRFLGAHIRLTQELQDDPQSFMPMINEEIERITGKGLDEEVLRGAMENVVFDYHPSVETYEKFFQMGHDVGIHATPKFDVNNMFTTAPLQAAEAEVNSRTNPTTSSKRSIQ